MSVLKGFVKDTAIYGMATVMPRVMNILLVSLHTAKLANASYADNTSFYVGAAFINVLLTFGMETAFFRFFSKANDNTKLYSTVFIALLGSTCILLGCIALLYNPITHFLEIPLYYFWLLLGLTALDTLVVAPFAYLRAQGKALKFTGFKMANLFIFVILNLFFYWAIPKFNLEYSWYKSGNPVYIFIANIIASAITLLLLVPDLFKIKLVFDKAIFKQLWHYGWPIMVAGLAFVVNEQLDKVLLLHFENKDVAGAYSACYKLAVFMTVFIQAFRLGAEPFFFNHAKEKNAPKTYATILKYFTIIGSIGLIVVVMFIDFLKELIISNESYWYAVGIVPYILLANLFLGIYHNLAVWYKLTDKTHYGMYFSLIGAIVTIIINVFLISRIGFMASAYATLVAYGLMMVISYVYGQRHYTIPYHTGRITFYLFTATLIAGLSFYVFRENYVINSILLLLFLISFYLLERKELRSIFIKK